MVPGYIVPGTWHQASGTWNLAPDNQYRTTKTCAPDTWNMRTWHLRFEPTVLGDIILTPPKIQIIKYLIGFIFISDRFIGPDN